MGPYKETYEIEVVPKPDDDGLKRYGRPVTKATGLEELYQVEQILHLFVDLSNKSPGSKVKLGRVIKFYCNTCRCLIGEKTIPLRIESRLPNFADLTTPEAFTGIKVEQYRCVACGYHTRYSVQETFYRCY